MDLPGGSSSEEEDNTSSEDALLDWIGGEEAVSVLSSARDNAAVSAARFNTSSRNWTCDACGCRTNTAADRSCSICGTSRSLSHSVLFEAASSGALFRRARMILETDENVNSAAGAETSSDAAPSQFSTSTHRAGWFASRLQNRTVGNDNSRSGEGFMRMRMGARAVGLPLLEPAHSTDYIGGSHPHSLSHPSHHHMDSLNRSLFRHQQSTNSLAFSYWDPYSTAATSLRNSNIGSNNAGASLDEMLFQAVFNSSSDFPSVHERERVVSENGGIEGVAPTEGSLSSLLLQLDPQQRHLFHRRPPPSPPPPHQHHHLHPQQLPRRSLMHPRFFDVTPRPYSHLDPYSAAATAQAAAIAAAPIPYPLQSIHSPQYRTRSSPPRNFLMSRLSPQEILAAATLAAAEQSPLKWWTTPLKTTTTTTGSTGDIQIQDNVGRVPLQSKEGRAIRTETPININDTCGYRVVFDHPGCFTVGAPMGGCFLVGVVTSHFFTQYLQDEALSSSLLAQSSYFYGIEDCGRKYEGVRRSAMTTAPATTTASSSIELPLSHSNYFTSSTINHSNSSSRGWPPHLNSAVNSSSSRGLRRPITSISSTLSPFAQDISASDVPFNSHNVLFGSQEVITMAYHMGTLTFWRDKVLLGTLITTLPQSAGTILFPVVVPFNRGVTVAITGLEANPVPLLNNFVSDWRKVEREQNKHQRSILSHERSLLIQNGNLTPQLRHVLTSIFSLYCSNYSEANCNPYLSYCHAARLWYRCGMNLSNLKAVGKNHSQANSAAAAVVVQLEDFLSIMERVAAEDEMAILDIESAVSAIDKSGYSGILDFPCMRGDKAALVSGYEQFGDASDGPLNPGDCGIVVDMQCAPNGDRRSVQILHGGRRWWYQPQAILTERSGLIHSSGVRFFQSVLRAHSFDPTSMTRLNQAPKNSATVGDWVKAKTGKAKNGVAKWVYGRIAAERACVNPTRGSSSESGSGLSLPVEFVDKSFAVACGVKLATSDIASIGVVTRRVKAIKVVHCSAPEVEKYPLISGSCTEDYDIEDDLCNISDRLFTEIAAVSRFDLNAMECIARECQLSFDTLASMFASGLPNAVLTSIDVAERQMRSLEPKEDLPDKIVSIGKLSRVIAKQLFSINKVRARARNKSSPFEEDALETFTLSTSDPPVSPSTLRTEPARNSPSLLHGGQMRQRARETVSRQDRFRGIGDENYRSSPSVAVLQQRQEMLLRLISSSRGGDVVDDLEEKESNVFRGIFSSVPSIHGNMQDTLNNIEIASECPDELSSENIASGIDYPTTFLDSILRFHKENVIPVNHRFVRHNGSAFVRNFVVTGLLINNLSWVEACVETYLKKTLAGTHKSSTMLKCLRDEDGVPLLRLAINFGCSPAILNFMIKHGTSVEKADVEEAANSDQAESVTVLLNHIPYQDIEMCENYSQSVRQAFVAAKARQEQLEQKMCDEAGAFMVQLLRRFLKLGLTARRGSSFRVEVCSKVVADILDGNVLLQDNDATDESDGTEGLVGLLPCEIIQEALLADAEYFGTFLALIEEFLCSTELNDGATGLSLLRSVLLKVPEIQSCEEIDRFGILIFISLQENLASSRSADIKSRQCGQGTIRYKQGDGICCPNKHNAALFITGHSSFRCDVCGNGIDQGRPMYGCRVCDWDVCEVCVDKRQSGILKCIKVKKLASAIRRLLSVRPTTSILFSDNMPNGCRQNLPDLTSRLLRKDIRALRDIGIMMLTPGMVSIHQFLSIVLPAFYSAYISNLKEEDFNMSLKTTSRRSKKARTIEGLSELSLEFTEDNAMFCKQSIGLLVSDEDDNFVSTDSIQPCADTFIEGVNASSSNDVSGESMNLIGSTSCIKGKEINFSTAFLEFLRRLHQILALKERVELTSSVSEDLELPLMVEQNNSDLQNLLKPINIRLHSSKLGFTRTSEDCALVTTIDVEPLVPVQELSLHVLRTNRLMSTNHQYLDFCAELVRDQAILIERPLLREDSWRVAKVTDFDCETGAHILSYGTPHHEVVRTTFTLQSGSSAHFLNFDKEEYVSVILATREYFIIHRSAPSEGEGAYKRVRVLADSAMDIDPICTDGMVVAGNELLKTVGRRVEYKCEKGQWKPCTVLSISSNGTATIVSDNGVVMKGISSSQIRTYGYCNGSHVPDRFDNQRTTGEDRVERDSPYPAFPFPPEDHSQEPVEFFHLAPPPSRLLVKRTWSALSLVDATHPIDLCLGTDLDSRNFKVQLGEKLVNVALDSSNLEASRKLTVHFSLHENSPGTAFDSKDVAVIKAIRDLQCTKDKCSEWNFDQPVALFCTIVFDSQATRFNSPGTNPPIYPMERKTSDDCLESIMNCSRARKINNRPLSSDENKLDLQLCQGLDEVCIQCMEAISLLSKHAHDSPIQSERDILVETLFTNSSLSKKLNDQLDDSLVVVSRAIPRWCIIAPSFAPCVFAYDSRRLLLERLAFGVSRSVLKQQESKVNVSRLRERMASLRARAVELVSEAFSGGADDPTALQLQADELYGMEEALATQVRSAFLTAKWQEHVLQVAKAVVRRVHLLQDAALVMQRFSGTDVSQRRLEVRFDGESGFDAASGSEAGVTRGFYADVAESLLSANAVAGVYCSSSCASTASLKMLINDADTFVRDQEASKLPLWIPDMDASAQVVIPTPRADGRSAPGVFPRPLPIYHPQLPQVFDCFRFMGRLFAAALRDGFMFPLPLSSSFLKLVQRGINVAMPSPTVGVSAKAATGYTILLTSADLPRAGFLGGHVYATEAYICKALNIVDSLEPPLSSLELERRYKEIASDRKFSRIALGKLFDCSFEDYFQDRTFVDPLDPSQGIDAVPLCPNGFKKQVTIYNVREWVTLCKAFILHDGVIAQAHAFRLGVEDFFSADYLRLFTPEELQRDVCGVGDDVDEWDETAVRKIFKLDGGKGANEALVAVAAIGGEGGAALSRRFELSSPTIGFLVKALVDATPQQRRQFLNFVTSVPIVTPGRIEVVPIVSPMGDFLPLHDPACLPRANTCARRLYLPKFETQESFSSVLWAVVREESKFKGFFEWRG